MKNYSLYLALIFLVSSSCNSVQRDPGRIYMPDMTYSRAYETYSDHSNLAGEGIYYTSLPVPGTIARGEELPYPIAKDMGTDTSHYFASRQVQNPLPALDTAEMKEAQRLYLINCAICHGSKLDGNGPLVKGGNGPYPAQPANFIDPSYQGGKIYNMPEGQMFYSATYGKNLMGSYASQLSRKQRWMVVRYIKSKQGEANNKNAASTDSSAVAAK